MSEPAFQQLQRRFAAHLRNPDNPPPEGIEDRRLAVYRELVFNNINGFLQQGFPVLHELLPAARWQRLARAFVSRHSCHSPYFLEIPREFVAFLSRGQGGEAGDPPFLLELAHYEWMELVLDAATETLPETGINPEGDLLGSVPALSPLQVVLSYHYPVHQICADFQPSEPLAQPVWLLVYRNRQDRVGFMEINPPTARLIQLMEEYPGATGRELVAKLGKELGFADREKLEGFAGEILQQLRANDILLGTQLDSL